MTGEEKGGEDHMRREVRNGDEKLEIGREVREHYKGSDEVNQVEMK